jgi:hypothetical protein
MLQQTIPLSICLLLVALVGAQKTVAEAVLAEFFLVYIHQQLELLIQ